MVIFDRQINDLKLAVSKEQEATNYTIREYEKKLDIALNLPWATGVEFNADDFDNVSGVQECFDGGRYLKDNPPVRNAIEQGMVSSAWDHWLNFGQMQRRFARFNLPYEVLNDRNIGEDVYILLEGSDLSAIEKAGVNSQTTLEFATFDTQSSPSYILVSNFRDYMIAAKMAPPESSVIMLRSIDDAAETLQTLALPHIDIDQTDLLTKRGLPRYLTGPKAPLYGQNDFVAAIHLAFVMGSRRIIFVGDLPDGGDETGEYQHLPQILTSIKSRGVDVISTVENSSLNNFGAPYQALDSLLERVDFRAENYLVNDGYTKGSNALFVSKASGSWIFDRDGQRFLDTGMASGTAILGHANPAVNRSITEALKDGALFSKPTPSGEELGWHLHEAFPWFSHFALCSTGSEATMRLIRIARSYTGKKKIALFAGGWHGTHDFLLVDDDALSPEDKPNAFLRSNGSPEELLDLILLLPYNRDAAFEIIRSHKDEIAAVITEPFQGSNPKEVDVEFMRELRSVTKDCDVLLAFDEIITGGRLGIGGFQEKYDIKADLASYGKIFGGGLPLGFVGGVNEIMGSIQDPEVRGGGRSNDKSVVLGGTFAGNPLTISAAISILKNLRENADELYPYIDQAGQRMRDEINRHCEENDIKARMYGVGSICRLIMSDQDIISARHRDEVEVPKAVQKAFYEQLLERNIHVGGNRLIFIACTHTPDQIDLIIEAFNSVLSAFKKDDLL
ncbi:MAG: aminotransferase class III-fold pyridoxal phosphate-dependent enzyme [Pseudomonadota bacterium]|nr:aminotransferase class III-fold pyridoxal phosphate-dependent enzyme [Pseudomonadota bacterium]